MQNASKKNNNPSSFQRDGWQEKNISLHPRNPDKEAGRAGKRGCCLHLRNVCSSENRYGSGGFGVLLKARKKFLAASDELNSRQQVGRMEQLSISCHDGEEISSSPLLRGQQLQPAGPRATSCGCGHLGFSSF